VIASTGRDRCWFAERWAEVAASLRAECGARCVILGGRSEYEVETAERIAALTDAAPINALGSGLRVLLGLIDACDLVIAPDTGPLHMAVAMDVPVVGLYGYTNPKRAGPYRKYHELLVDRFGDPGEDYSPGERYRPGRMQLITAGEVFEKARLGLERYAAAGPWRRERSSGGSSTPLATNR
jgi:heptosyltransferase I